MESQLISRFGYDLLPLDDGYVPVESVAAALDPRTKGLDFLQTDEHSFVWEEIKRLAMMSLDRLDERQQQPAQAPQPRPPNAMARLLHTQGRHNTTPEGSIDADINRYRSEAPTEVGEDSLAWWKSRSGSYPTLAALAKV